MRLGLPYKVYLKIMHQSRCLDLIALIMRVTLRSSVRNTAVIACLRTFGSTALLSLRRFLVRRNSSTKKLLLDSSISEREYVSASMLYFLLMESRNMNATLCAPYL